MALLSDLKVTNKTGTIFEVASSGVSNQTASTIYSNANVTSASQFEITNPATDAVVTIQQLWLACADSNDLFLVQFVKNPLASDEFFKTVIRPGTAPTLDIDETFAAGEEWDCIITRIGAGTAPIKFAVAYTTA